MGRIQLLSVFALCLSCLLSDPVAADIRDDYELTVAAAVAATEGWQLYLDGKFAGTFEDGRYTDPAPRTRVKDFWSNGRLAKLDREGNGHFETVFIVVDRQLTYVGSIGSKGHVVHAAKDYKRYVGRPVAHLLRDIDERAGGAN
jgi:hypothetical protein